MAIHLLLLLVSISESGWGFAEFGMGFAFARSRAGKDEMMRRSVANTAKRGRLRLQRCVDALKASVRCVRWSSSPDRSLPDAADADAVDRRS